jgi:hypothetical protein
MKNLRCCFIGILILTMLFGQTSMAADEVFSSAVDNCHATYFPAEGKLLIPCMYTVDATGNMQAYEAVMEQISTSDQWQFVVKQISASQDNLIAENVPSCRAVYLTEYGRLLIPCVDVVDLSGKVESSHQAMMEQLPVTVVELPKFVVTEVDGDSTQESLRSGLRGIVSLGGICLKVFGSGSGLVTGDISGMTPVKCSKNSSSSITGGCRVVYFKNTLVTLTATPDNGSKFVKWDGPCLGGNLTSTRCKIQADTVQVRSITAQFDKNTQPQTSVTRTVKITLSGDGKGQVENNLASKDCNNTSCQVNMPAIVPLTFTLYLYATPAIGSVFGGWSGACTGTSTTCILKPGSQSLVLTTATFMKKK